jgi:hypothetical protein
MFSAASLDASRSGAATGDGSTSPYFSASPASLGGMSTALPSGAESSSVQPLDVAAAGPTGGDAQFSPSAAAVTTNGLPLSNPRARELAESGVLAASASRAVSQWRVTTPPLHPASPLSLPTPAADERQSEPHRRRPSQQSSTPLIELNETTAGEGCHRDTLGSPSSPPRSVRLPAPSVSGGGTPRRRQSQPRQPDDEELTQLARSLRSEIVGEPFLLTAPAFSPLSRGPCSTSRPPSAVSNVSAGGDAAVSRVATATATGLAVVPALAVSGSPSATAVGIGIGAAGKVGSTQGGLPDRLLALVAGGRAAEDGGGGGLCQRRQGDAADISRRPASTIHAGSSGEEATSEAEATAHVPAREPHVLSPPVHGEDLRSALPSKEREGEEATTDGLHTVAELRRRLLTEDFFSSPFRKFRRDGTFPWKLFTSVVLCVLLVLQVTWYQLPLARANESMRRAITEQFMGDDFDSKGHGDIVAAPTTWMEGIYSSIEHYVGVYYNLSNTSSSDMNYYVSPPRSSVGGGEACFFAPSTNASTAAPATWYTTVTEVNDSVVAVTNSPPSIPISSIAPVLMRIRVDTYSRREGAHHTDAAVGVFAALHRGGWWGWASAADAFAESHSADVEVENGETRWLTFLVDAARPLGPLAKYRDAALRLRKARRRQRREAADLRRRNKELVQEASRGDDTSAGGRARKPTRQLRAGGARDTSPSATAVDAALAMVCRSRLDELSGRFYRPCASVPTGFPTATAEGDSVVVDGAGTSLPPSPLSLAFSLMDNVRSIHLTVTLRHETGSGGNTLRSDTEHAQASGSSGIGALFRRNYLRGAAGGAVEEAAVFQWKVTKVIEVHPGGLVETQLHVQTRVWPKGTSIGQLWGPTHAMAALLGALGALELVLRVRALWRIKRYQERLHKERLAFHARRMSQLQHTQQHQCHEKGETGGGDQVSPTATAAAAVPLLPPPHPHKTPVEAVTVAVPHEWGLPGSPAVLRVRRDSDDGGTFPMAGTAETMYGTLPLPLPRGTEGAVVGGRGEHNDAEGEVRAAHGATSPESADAPLSRRTMPVLLSESSPLLVRDTSLSILAAHHLAAGSRTAHFVSDAEEEDGVRIPAAAAARHTPSLAATDLPFSTSDTVGHTWGRRVSGSWFGRQLGRLFPHHLPYMVVRQRTPSPPAAPTATRDALFELNPALRSTAARPLTPTSGALRGLFPSPVFGVSPVTPQLTRRLMERIAERSYVDLRSTWRHHLQQSMGTGWHGVGIVAAVLTLSYSAMLLLPLLPCVAVAQDDGYDAWTSVLLGTAALTSCVLLLSYLRFFPTLYFPILASTYVVPKLFLFALCVSPLFFGFAVFFVVAFGPHSRGHFDSLGWASMGLYLMTYGDSLLDTVEVISDTPYAVTTFLASAMVITFALLFMTIMLNIAMTITQHEWLRLRRRFGAALSSSSLLFSVRSRAEVKAEAVDAVRTNLEVLWFMLAEEEGEEEEEKGEGASTQPSAETAAAATTVLVTAKKERGTATGKRRRGREVRRVHRGRHASAQPQRSRHLCTPEEFCEEAESASSGGGGEATRAMGPESSSYDVSAATTVPPE